MMGGDKQMDSKDMDASGKARPQKDSAKPKSGAMTAGSSSHSCCWTPDDD
jgi:hypothetical protein